MCRRESPVCSIAPEVLLFFLLLSLFLRKSLTDFSGDKIGIVFYKESILLLGHLHGKMPGMAFNHY